jgi:hypothetical protein
MKNKLFLERLRETVDSLTEPIVVCVDIYGEEGAASFVVMNGAAKELDPLQKSSIFHCMTGLLADNLAEYEGEEDRPDVPDATDHPV